MAQVKKNLKNNVQKYRVWRGLLQKDLADAIGISISEMRLIERNKVTPKPENQEKLCEFFEVSYDQMFYR
jgi:DNA-binding XRE family transcriptional regulator